MFEIKYLYQRWEGFETSLRVDEEKWIRIDFFLEYFLTGDIKLTKNFKGDFKSYLGNVKYASEFLEAFGNLILDETKFNYEKYIEWMKNKMEVNKVLAKINHKPIA